MAGGLVQIDWNPDERTLRQFGWIALGGFGLLATAAWFEVLIFRFGLGAARVPVVCALAGLGVLAALLSLIAPRANRWLFLGLVLISFPIGLVVSQVVIALMFFGLFAPVGFLIRKLGQDPLERARDPQRASYWVDARPPRPADRYFRQF
jgi:hypothetical protein